MGTDILGWVELRKDQRWMRAVDIRPFVVRDSDAFGCLFGVNNRTSFSPIAERRGLPADASRLVREVWDKVSKDPVVHASSWVSLEEIERIDWDEESPAHECRIEVRSGADRRGDTILDSEAEIPGLTDEQRAALRRAEPVRISELYPGRSGYPGPFELRRFPLTRGYALKSLARLFELMRWLGDGFGKENVRLIVWFDD
jgi:hypothetical protein